MSWRIQQSYLGKPIIFEGGCTLGFQKGMITLERGKYFLLSNDRYFDGAIASNKHGFKYSYWIACEEDITEARLEIRLARKMNHES